MFFLGMYFDMGFWNWFSLGCFIKNFISTVFSQLQGLKLVFVLFYSKFCRYSKKNEYIKRICTNSIIELEALAKFEDKPNPESRCSDDSNTESCSHSDKAKSRKKRVVTLPNLTSLVIQNRIVVPQPPAGLYIIWMRVRFFIRPMFTETLTG